MLGQGIVPVIPGKMAQLEYFGPLAAPPQVLFSNFCLKFLLLCGLQSWTAATAWLHHRVIQLEHSLRESSSRLGCCREPPRPVSLLDTHNPTPNKGILHTLTGVILGTTSHWERKGLWVGACGSLCLLGVSPGWDTSQIAAPQQGVKAETHIQSKSLLPPLILLNQEGSYPSISWQPSMKEIHQHSVRVGHTVAFWVWLLCLYSFHPWFRYKSHAGEVLVHCLFKTRQERKVKGGRCTRGAFPPSPGQWVTASPCWEKNHGGKQHSGFPWKLGAYAVQDTGLKCTMPFSWAVGYSWSLTGEDILFGEDILLDSRGHFTYLSHAGPLVRFFSTPLFQFYSYPLLTHPPSSSHHPTNTHLAMACFNHTMLGQHCSCWVRGKAKSLLPPHAVSSIHGRNSTSLSPAAPILPQSFLSNSFT